MSKSGVFKVENVPVIGVPVESALLSLSANTDYLASLMQQLQHVQRLASSSSPVVSAGERPPLPGDEFAQRATLRRMQAQLADIEERRDAHTLRLRGLSKEDIADRLATTPARVNRQLALADGDPTLLDVSPTELILVAYLNHGSRAELVERLAAWDYTFPEVVSYDGVSAGTWQQVVVAAARGLLTADEYQQVCDAVQPPSPGEAPRQAGGRQ